MKMFRLLFEHRNIGRKTSKMNRMFSKPKQKKNIQNKSDSSNREDYHKTLARSAITYDDDSYGYSPFQRMNKFDAFNDERRSSSIGLERGGGAASANITRSRSFMVGPRARPTPVRLSSLSRAGAASVRGPRSARASPLPARNTFNEYHYLQSDFFTADFYNR